MATRRYRRVSSLGGAGYKAAGDLTTTSRIAWSNCCYTSITGPPPGLVEPPEPP